MPFIEYFSKCLPNIIAFVHLSDGLIMVCRLYYSVHKFNAYACSCAVHGVYYTHPILHTKCIALPRTVDLNATNHLSWHKLCTSKIWMLNEWTRWSISIIVLSLFGRRRNHFGWLKHKSGQMVCGRKCFRWFYVNWTKRSDFLWESKNHNQWTTKQTNEILTTTKDRKKRQLQKMRRKIEMYTTP